MDVVVTTLGSVPFKPLDQLERADYLAGLTNTALGQVEIVRQASRTSPTAGRSR